MGNLVFEPLDLTARFGGKYAGASSLAKILGLFARLASIFWGVYFMQGEFIRPRFSFASGTPSARQNGSFGRYVTVFASRESCDSRGRAKGKNTGS